MSIQACRRRLPAVVFVLLALVCFALLGFACACFTDHPMDAVVQAIAAIPLAAAVIELWPALVVGLAGVALVLVARRLPVASRSPATLQRFLL